MSNGWWSIVHAAVVLGLFYMLYVMQKRHVSFTKRVFVGLGIGIVYGAFLQQLYGAGHGWGNGTRKHFCVESVNQLQRTSFK